MDKSLHITAVLDQPDLLESLVEKLASRRFDIGYGLEQMPREWKAIEISSTETFVSGTLSLSDNANNAEKNAINMPFITPMLFTCIKEEQDSYRLLWSSSLS
jgi:hypothetical protein